MEWHILGDMNCNVGASTLDHETKVLTATLFGVNS